MKKFIIGFLILSVSCKDKAHTFYKDGFKVKSKVTNDSIIDGKAEFFKNDILYSSFTFKNGIKDGLSLNYYRNGRLYDSCLFSNGLQNGYRYVFDSTGMLSYVEYYLYGKKIGPEFFYENDSINYFDFNDFENNRIYSQSYKNGKTISANGSINNLVAYPTSDSKTVGLFLYFLNPPRLSISYKLILSDSILKKTDTLEEFKRNNLFIDTLLPKPMKGKFYEVVTDVFDSSNGTGKVYVDKLIYQ